MAFGRIRKKRARKQKKLAQQEAERQQFASDLAAAQDPRKIAEEMRDVDTLVSEAEAADEPRREQVREKAKQQAYEDVTTDIPGMSDQQRRGLQETANAQIRNQVNNYSRVLASQAGAQGRRGGTAAAQQMELSQQGMNAQNQFQRDLMEKDFDIAMKKLAAYLASMEGSKAEDILRRGQRYDYLTGRQNQAKQDVWATRWDKIFSGV